MAADDSSATSLESAVSSSVPASLTNPSRPAQLERAQD
jgi:hypothetical protein